MRSSIFVLIYIFSNFSMAAITADGCKAKIQAAHQARTGTALNDGTNNVLIDICKGIIDEIKANAKVPLGISVQVNPSTGSGSTTAQGTVE